ncbi:MAG: GPW/gp25 family protein [Lachnospiraceae bacterium]|jgi:phage baseplate assembly protein W|nr:GPW/gp25 family protein [Lachnospiraceae bacterium]MCR5425822.1 GPW/gp25 family protein [Lachnospiraceae bacterium]
MAQSTTDKSFLGTGMKFPPQIDVVTGRFKTSSLEESVKESIYIILMTQQTERFVRPDFGCNLMSYTFMDINATTTNILVREITEAILSQEPRIADVNITTEMRDSQGVLLINIDYTLQGSNTSDNLVFPFYLNVEAEQPEKEEELEVYEPTDVEES